MKISVVGTGYVGLVTGACFSDAGHEVLCIDNDPKKIDLLHKGVMPIYEPGLDEIVARRVDFLTAYQDRAYAESYRALVEKARAVSRKICRRSVPDRSAVTSSTSATQSR